MLAITILLLVTAPQPQDCRQYLSRPWPHPFRGVDIELVNRVDTAIVTTLRPRASSGWLWPRVQYRDYYYNTAAPDTTLSWDEVLTRVEDAMGIDLSSDVGQRTLWAYAATYGDDPEARVAHELLRRAGLAPSLATEVLGELILPLATRSDALFDLDTLPLDEQVPSLTPGRSARWLHGSWVLIPCGRLARYWTYQVRVSLRLCGRPSCAGAPSSNQCSDARLKSASDLR